MRRLVAALEALPRDCRMVTVVGERGTGKQRIARHLHQRWGGRGKVVVVDGRLPHADKAEPFSARSSGERGQAGLLLLAHIDAIERRVLREILGTSRVRLGERDGCGLVATALDPAALARVDAGYAGRELQRAPVITVPPLRERRPDMPQLVRELLQIACDDVEEDRKTISSEALDALAAYHWPENVGELVSVLEHAVFAASDRTRVERSDLPGMIRGSPDVVEGDPAHWPTLAEVEKRWIIRTLQRCGGSRALAADALGIHINTLGRKLKEYGIGRTRSARGPR